jgi:hypothetical protein
LTVDADLSAVSNSSMALAMRDTTAFDPRRLGLPAGSQLVAYQEGTDRQTYAQKGKDDDAEKNAGSGKSGPQPKDKAPDGKAIDRMIKDLGDDSFKVREKASKDLEKVGQVAISKLVEAANSSPDLEVVKRAERLIEQQINEMLNRTGNVSLNLEKLAHAFTMGPGGPVRGPVNDETLKMIADSKTFKPQNFTESDGKAVPELMKWKNLPEHKKEALKFLTESLKNPIDPNKTMVGLNLIRSDVSDKGIDDLVSSMPNLKTLYISGTRLTDKGLDKLGGLKNLERIMFDRQFSDEAIVNFVKQSKNLKELCILDQSKAERLSEKLKKINPDLKVQAQGMTVSDNADNILRQLRKER